MSTCELRSIVSGTEESAGEAMLHQDRWEEVRRLHFAEGRSVSAIARLMELDRKTVRRCLRQSAWQPYRRAPRRESLLTEHADFLRQRAPAVRYSARILFQELTRERAYRGGYDTVKRFIAPLRELAGTDALCQTWFETAPGEQSQVDWGQIGAALGGRAIKLHVFVLTLGYSRRGFYWATPDERLPQFLEAHERAFAHFGGRTREHLYDRPRIVCRPDGDGRTQWNPTFRAFADYCGFEPRLCRAYRAQTKGKVKSGVKYVKRNFLPGRSFHDIDDFLAQLADWNASIADTRIHGTTHEPPLARFAGERAALIATSGQAPFALGARVSRIVASDWLVSFASNRYSVPFPLIGQTVEVEARGDAIRIYRRGALIATHPRLAGAHQLRILPEHGPGALGRYQHQRRSAPPTGAAPTPAFPDVEIRDLALYDTLAHAHTPETRP